MKLNLDTGEKVNAIYEALGQYVENNDEAIENDVDGELGGYFLATQEAAREMLEEFNRTFAVLATFNEPRI